MLTKMTKKNLTITISRKKPNQLRENNEYKQSKSNKNRNQANLNQVRDVNHITKLFLGVFFVCCFIFYRASGRCWPVACVSP